MALLAKKIDHDYVLFRINNWEERLGYLYSDIYASMRWHHLAYNWSLPPV